MALCVAALLASFSAELGHALRASETIMRGHRVLILLMLTFALLAREMAHGPRTCYYHIWPLPGRLMRAIIILIAATFVACASDQGGVASGRSESIVQGAQEAPSDEVDSEPIIVCTPEARSCDDNAVWGCNAEGTERMFMGYCPSGSLCEAGECTCVPQCGAKACGDDSCGGSCGECDISSACMPDGSCCERGCEERSCGPDACGGSCGSCEEALVCLEESGLCCSPECEGKSCGPDGCGGLCGACDEGVSCPLNGVCGCEPQCEDVTCVPDGCGGLCDACFTFHQDAGSTETAFGYESAPAGDPSAVVCMVRISLPHTEMRLSAFSAGWMYGLWELQVPFELVVARAADMNCQKGDESTWWTEACLAPESVLTPLTSLLPAPPFEPHGDDELGEHIMPSSEIFIGARFLLAEYPIYVCPVDESGSGADSFMFPIALEDGEPTLNASSFQNEAGDVGAMALQFAFELSPNSLPVEQ